ncbi:TetR/AcrR family transcriptional regulator [Ruania zhangjianzhongii]|uniref:TetR/AcrR family transcriptional regulator n=1 Tax=Ruania zhangjianzhongii TaxID=2603206 RepID=UPI0011C7015E|nr:TetR/AcrR family transcriptional regulator [Ruania zhangjianzhongii]
MSPREELLGRVVAHLAEHGVGDTSLRTLAERVGTSHRMLIYHFGSRDGLLTAVVASTWARRPQDLEALLTREADPLGAARALWQRLADEASLWGPLFFECAAAAMQGRAWASTLRDWVAAWNEVLTEVFLRAGHRPEQAARNARTALALARGALFELCLSGDRVAADELIEGFLSTADHLDGGGHGGQVSTASSS